MKIFLLMLLVALVTIGQAESEDFECEGGSQVPASWKCDGECDCQMCDDEADCDNNYGISKFKIGDLMAKLHLKQEGGGIGMMTEHVPEFLWYYISHPVMWLFECITTGHCPTPN